MMNIREYFDTLRMNAQTEEEFDNVCETEYEVYEWYCDDDSDLFDKWVEANEIDLTATEMVGYVDKHKVKVITLWAWDFDEA